MGPGALFAFAGFIMQWLNWTNRLIPRVRRRSHRRPSKPENLAPFLPRIYRLEDRRVLDVTAAFSSVTGQLDIVLANSAETASIEVVSGNLSITDSQNNQVPISVDGNPSTAINASSVDAIHVSGDAAPGQAIEVESALALPKGLVVEASIEQTTLLADLFRIDQGSVQIDSALTHIGGDILTMNQDIAFGGNVKLLADVQLTGNNVRFSGSLDDDGVAGTGGSLLIAATGLTRFGSSVGLLAPLANLETDAPGRTELNGSISATGNTVHFADPVTLTNHSVIIDTGSVGIVFGSTVDSAAGSHFNLTLSAPNGQIRFNGNLGAGTVGDQRLGNLKIADAEGGVLFGEAKLVSEIRVAGSIDIGVGTGSIGGAGIVFTGGPLGVSLLAGDQVRLNGATVLGSDVQFQSSGNITFTAESKIDSQSDLASALALDAGAGAVFFNADLGSVLPLRGLTITQADAGVVFGSADTASAAGTGPVTQIHSVGPIQIGSQSNVILGGVTFNAGVGQLLTMTTTNDPVAIHGSVTLESGLTINTGSGVGDIRFQTGPINSAAGENNDLVLNAGAGSVFFSNDLGTTAPLGGLTILQAGGGVTFGTADTASGGNGPVAQIIAHGNIDVGAGASEIAGTGIQFNGGTGRQVNITSETGDLRFNGAVVLGSDFTVQAGRDITFTNDSPVDSRIGESYSLVLDAAGGKISINEDLGRITSLNQLTVVQARDGFILGGATSEIPGSGGSGPVEIVRLEGSLNFGSGTNVIGGAGVVLSGSAIAPQRITTTDDAVRLNGAVTLETDVVIETGLTGARIQFTNAASINSGITRHSSLIMDAGTASIEFNEDLGLVRPLGSLTVIRADNGVVFGAADTETAIGDGPVNAIFTDQPIDIGNGTNVIGGRHIVFNGGTDAVQISTTDDNVRLNGQVRLHSDLRIDTGDGAGDIIFTSAATINSDDSVVVPGAEPRRDLVLDAGDGGVFFNANIGEAIPLATLIVDRAAKGVVFGGADTAVDGGAGPVTEVHVQGPVDLGSGITPDDLLGSVVFNAGDLTLALLTFGNDLRVNGPVILQSDVEVDTGAEAGDVLFTSVATIDSQLSESNSLNLKLANGNASFQAAIGSGNRLGDLILDAVQNVEFDGELFVTRIEQSSGTGRTTFRSTVNANHPTMPGLELKGTEFLFELPVLGTGNGRISIDHSGTLTILAAADFRLDGAFSEAGSGNVQLAGDVATSGDSISFNSPVTLTDGNIGTTLLSTVAGGQTAGGSIQFGSTLSGQTAGSERLLLNAGTAGNIQFEGAVGDPVPLGLITVVLAHDVIFGRLNAQRFVQLDGTGTTVFGETLLNHATLAALDVRTRDIRFLDTVTTTGHGGVVLDARNSIDLADAADMFLQGPFQQVGSAAVRTSANITTSGDNILFSGPVTIRDDVNLNTGTGSGSVIFTSTLDGAVAATHDLVLDLDSGDLEFIDAVGNLASLDRVQINSAENVRIADEMHVSSLIQAGGTGTTLVDGIVTATGPNGIQLATHSILVNGSLDARSGTTETVIDLEAVDLVRIQGSLFANGSPILLSSAKDLLFASTAVVQSDSGTITLTSDDDQAGGGKIEMADGAQVQSESALIQFFATDDIQVGRIATTAQVTLLSRSGGIRDAGDALGTNVVASSLRIQSAAGIGVDTNGPGDNTTPADPLETQVQVLAASNSTAGGILIRNAGAGDLTLGIVDGLSGLLNNGSGPIRIFNSGTLHVQNAVLHRGGGTTELTADFPGDLIVDAPIQNTGGDGSILLFAGGDLVIHNSLPEPPGKTENPANPEQFFEIMVSGEGAVRGQARDEVLLDEGESDYVIVRTATGQITHAMPMLKIRIIDQGGSDIDEQGRGFVEVTLGDDVHLETNYHVQIEWGDGEIENYPIPGTIHPLREPGNIDPRFVSGEADEDGMREQGIYTFSHKYFQHPNPDDPSTPIPIRVELRYDARASGDVSIDATRPEEVSAVFNGIRFFNQAGNELIAIEDSVFTVPGTGNFTFIKIVESVIVPVEFRTVNVEPPVQTAPSFTSTTGLRGDFRTTSIELQRPEEYRFFLTVVDDVLGTESEERIDLDIELLSDPLSLFRTRKFPNGHYRVYLEEVRTRRVRLILDVHVFNGKVVPPNYREGSGEKQPGADQAPNATAPSQPPANQNGAISIDERLRFAVLQPETQSEKDVSDAIVSHENESDRRWSEDVRAMLTGEPRTMTKAARRLRQQNEGH